MPAPARTFANSLNADFFGGMWIGMGFGGLLWLYFTDVASTRQEIAHKRQKAQSELNELLGDAK